MRELLRPTDQRRLALVELLLDSDDWVSVTHLSKILNSSSRMIKEDLTFIRNNTTKLQVETSTQGVRLVLDYSAGIKDYYQLILHHSLPFQILEEIFFDESLSVQDLAEKLHTSSSTIYRTINQLNDYFSDYQCTIESNPCRFIGDEHYIRNYYRAYFKESSTVLDWPFQNIDETLFDESYSNLESFFTKHSNLDLRSMDFASYKTLKLLLIVNIIRFSHGHRIDKTNDQNLFFDIFFRAVKLLILPKNFELIEGQAINSTFFNQVFYPYFKDNLVYDNHSLHTLRQNDSLIDNALRYLEDELIQISHSIGIDINLDVVIASIYRTTYIEDDDPNAHYILYNRNEIFAQRFNKEYPHIYQSFYNALFDYRRQLNLDLDPEKINHLLFTLVNTWKNLLTEIQLKFQKVSILVISDTHYSHAHMMQQLLISELPSNVNIKMYKNRYISCDRLNEYESDIIVSTFDIPSLNNKDIIMINHYPSKNDLNKIEVAINKLVEEKMRSAILI